MKPEKPNVFEYSDYRSFLRHYFQYFKATRKGFSYRSLNLKAGFKSPNFIKLVIEGKRNLTEKSSRAVATAFGLNKQSSMFFDSLVQFTQAKTTSDKQAAYERMLSSKRFREIKQVETDKYGFYSSWYISAIRELVCLENFEESPSWIASRLTPRISVAEAEDGLNLLIRLGLLSRSKAGKLVQNNASLSTGHEVQSLVIAKFHKEMIHLASTSMERFTKDEREIGSVSLGIRSSDIKELKDRIFRFRQELVSDFGSRDKNITEVYQFNIQLFPLTANKSGGSK
ncbi:MAG: hypothetical protein COV44_01330 [Deltaproteobacteria bacterium CG11_big_fil_rev_8_21_14_0_20_45_16]|nr:MAG: hypothetical protein COV44_01330 [Deltaproteobacteria bacterium CG11_big_fil_rev_8_21_14_0_20_45_16]